MTITHPFSPLKGQEYIFVERINAWGEDRIICCDEQGKSRAVLTSWTDYPADELFNTASGLADFRFDDLQMLAKLIADIKAM